MVQKLYKLKKSQLDQQFMLKQRLLNKINNLESKIKSINYDLASTGVQKYGAIGDFRVLAIHKESMKYEKSNLFKQKSQIEIKVKEYDNIIIKYQQEVEKYSYLLTQQKKVKIKEEQKYDEMVASEYVQSKYNKQAVL